MTAALAIKPNLHELDTRPSALEVFQDRCEARAYLCGANGWGMGCARVMEPMEAIDGLQHDAETSGLVAEVGQDKIQAVLAHYFGGHDV
jgi:hypothetical protein